MRGGGPGKGGEERNLRHIDLSSLVEQEPDDLDAVAHDSRMESRAAHLEGEEPSK